MATVRISEKTHAKLKKVARDLRLELDRPVSMNEVLKTLLESRKQKPSDYQGAWKMTHKEADELFKSQRQRWARWKYPSD